MRRETLFTANVSAEVTEGEAFGEWVFPAKVSDEVVTQISALVGHTFFANPVKFAWMMLELRDYTMLFDISNVNELYKTRRATTASASSGEE